jgi:Arc/MetJ family transcription regulator
MKTTLDIDDALLADAKAVAARRRTTLRAMVEHALRRELAPAAADDPAAFARAASGLPRLKKRGAVNPNAELHRRLAEGDVEEAIAWLDRPRPALRRG